MFTKEQILFLNWLNKKKGGNIYSSLKFPNYFKSRYNLNCEKLIKTFLNEDILKLNDNKIFLTNIGKQILSDYDYFIWLENNLSYQITEKDIVSHPNFKKISYNDIAWGIFQERYFNFASQIQSGVFNWTDLYLNYYNCSRILFEEKKYLESLKHFISGFYIEFSGMRNNNKIQIISQLSEQFHIYDSEGQNHINMQYPIANIRKIIKFLNLNKNEFIKYCIKNELINESIIEDLLPFHYFNYTDLVNIITHEVFEEDKEFVCTMFFPENIKINIPQNLK